MKTTMKTNRRAWMTTNGRAAGATRGRWPGMLALAAVLLLSGCADAGTLQEDRVTPEATDPEATDPEATDPEATDPEATLAAPAPQATPTTTPTVAPGDLLVFSKTAGFRHPSIADGLAALRGLADAHGFTLTATEDAAVFTDATLARYQAVVFLHTTGSVLDAAQQAALERYVGRGGGFVGVHAAADADPDWTWYHGLIGAPFHSHPEIQPATIHVTDRAHPATAHLPPRWQRTDEWYDFAASPRGTVRVLATLDETTYTGGRMGDDHPIAWCQSYAGGRSFYTALGHTPDSYTEPAFIEHLLGGIRYAAGLVDADCKPN